MEVSPQMADNPFQGERENFPPVHGLFGGGDLPVVAMDGRNRTPRPREVPTVPDGSDASPSHSPGTLPQERSAARQRAQANQSPSAASPSGSQLGYASDEFRDAGEALNDLSNMDNSMVFIKADAGLHGFNLGETPVNVRRGAVESPNTYHARKERERQELAAAQRDDEMFWNNRQPGPGSTPRPPGPPLYVLGDTPQQPPRSAESQRSGPQSGRPGTSATPPLWGPPSASIPEDRQASGSSNGDFGRGVTGALEDAETQTDVMIAPSLLLQLVPISPAGNDGHHFGDSDSTGIGAREANPVGLGAGLAEYQRLVRATTPDDRQRGPEHRPFHVSISPMSTAGTPVEHSIVPSRGAPSPMMTAFPGVNSQGVQSPEVWSMHNAAAPGAGAEQSAPADEQNAVAGNEVGARSHSAGTQSSQRDHDGRSFRNVESPPEGYFARDSELSAPPVSGSGSIVESGNDVTQGRAHSFDRSLPPPHPEAYASDDDGRPVSPIAQSKSPAHMAFSPSEFGGSPRHFGDAVEFETSPERPAGNEIAAISSIHSASPNQAAVRSLQQDFSEATESPVRSDIQPNPNSLGGSRIGVANTLSFSTAGGSRSGNGSDPVVHGGSGLMDSQASMHTVHAFSDESSGGHEFDDDLRESGIGVRRSVSSARSLGRDGRRPQRSPSSEIAAHTDPPEVQVSGMYTSPAAAQRVPPTEMQQPQQGSSGVHRVMDGQHGRGHLWMVHSDHHEETAQLNQEHAFLQGTTQQSNAIEPSQQASAPGAPQPVQQVSPPAIGGPTGASPLCATTAAAGYGQYGHLGGGYANNAVGADYQPPHQRYQGYPMQYGGARAARASPTPTGASPASAAGAATPTAETSPRPYSPYAGHPAYGVGTAYAFSTAAAMSSARVRPQTVLGTRTLSPSSATPFVSPFRIPPALSSWRTSLGYPVTSALLRPTASSLSFHRHYSSSPVYRSGLFR